MKLITRRVKKKTNTKTSRYMSIPMRAVPVAVLQQLLCRQIIPVGASTTSRMLNMNTGIRPLSIGATLAGGTSATLRTMNINALSPDANNPRDANNPSKFLSNCISTMKPAYPTMTPTTVKAIPVQLSCSKITHTKINSEMKIPSMPRGVTVSTHTRTTERKQLFSIPRSVTVSTHTRTPQRKQLPSIPKYVNTSTCIRTHQGVKTPAIHTRVNASKYASIYVLELEDGYIYVGKSKNIEYRIRQHMNKCGAVFTTIHAPTGKILHREGTLEGDGDGPERDETLRQMHKHGAHNVRGWKYCNRRISSTELLEIESNIREMLDLCRRCGRPGHFASKCSFKKSNKSAKK
jgi:hypothetical protein